MSAKYAQHFLTNKHAADRIVDALALTPSDVVLEIGPGKGALTSLLVGKAAKVVAVEIDPEMVERLKARLSWAKNSSVVQGDILEVDFSTFGAPGASFKIVGNLPYNLTSPILRRLSDWTGWQFAIVMVQKEVGDRLCASAGTPEYGALTAGMNLTCEMKHVFDLSEHSFDPPPKVKSSVVKIIRRESPLTDDVPKVQRVIQAAFQQRRKTILNSLSHGLCLDKAVVQQKLHALNIEETVRPERLEVEHFIALARALL